MLYPASFLADGGKGIYGNSLFRNDGDLSFSEVSDAVGAENFWPWGLSVGDLNADGFEDVLITSSMNYPWRYAVNSILLNDRGQRFLDAEFVVGVEPRAGGATTVPWFELDCAAADRYHRDCPQGAGKAGRVVVRAALGSRSSAIVDLDGDGDLDIVTNEFGSAPLVLVSDLSARRTVRSLVVDLQGTQSNRDGLGATVRVRAGGRTLTRVHDGKSGYMSQSSGPLYFGLGDAAQVDEIRVVWPSGREQVVPGPIEANTTVTVVEGG